MSGHRVRVAAALLAAACVTDVSCAIDAPRLAPLSVRRRRAARESRGPPPPPEYRIITFTQTLDHFNAENAGTFAQRYLVTDQYYKNGTAAPIFVFTGAEGGDVTDLYDFDYGHPRAVARKHGALILFLEHRFFGKSLPFASGSDDAKPDRVGLLSVEQGLADYATIIYAVREEYNAWDAKVVTFGGSLAGTLAALMRVRYPNLVDIGWASSTPLLGYPGIDGISQFSWRQQVTDNFQTLSPGCPAVVRRAFSALAAASASDVQKEFNVCEGSYAGVGSDVRGVAWGVLEGDGEFTYPSATSQIPNHCDAMRSAATDLAAFNKLIRAGAREYVEASGCINVTAWRLDAQTPDAKGWDYLACTEIVHPIGCNNVTDMFPPSTWSVASTAQWCRPTWGVTPRPGWIPQQFGLFHVQDRFARAHTRVLFAYGLMDPWHTLGVGLTNLSAELPVVVIPDGSHCADMEQSQPKDSKTMLAGRAREEAIISAWLG